MFNVKKNCNVEIVYFVWWPLGLIIRLHIYQIASMLYLVPIEVRYIVQQLVYYDLDAMYTVQT